MKSDLEKVIADYLNDKPRDVHMGLRAAKELQRICVELESLRNVRDLATKYINAHAELNLALEHSYNAHKQQEGVDA